MLPGSVAFGKTSRPSASILFVPVRAGAEVVGVLSIHSYTPKAYDSARAGNCANAGRPLCRGAKAHQRAGSPGCQRSELPFARGTLARRNLPAPGRKVRLCQPCRREASGRRQAATSAGRARYSTWCRRRIATLSAGGSGRLPRGESIRCWNRGSCGWTGPSLTLRRPASPLLTKASPRCRPSCGTSPGASSSSTSCASRRRWRPSASLPAGWRTTSTTCSRSSAATPNCC